MARTPKGSGRGAGSGNGTYEVGYGRPPKATQFQKGTSGNPGGKRKPGKPVTPKSLLHDALMRSVEIMDDGVPRSVPALGLAYMSLARDAAKGDTRAFKLLRDELKLYPFPPVEEDDALYNEDRAYLFERIGKMAERVEEKRRLEAEEAEAQARAREERCTCGAHHRTRRRDDSDDTSGGS